ncbi:hypothetical protein AGLY_012887 [Aphis glycines]|uniref:Uncharacterized protein n=1 Tax=Aphis glycines TaxID=307491 RepID=A0A6G0T7Z0_APHGL|nr:hypothetical protein AGLY_012887 [Aphis glycines]
MNDWFDIQFVLTYRNSEETSLLKIKQLMKLSKLHVINFKCIMSIQMSKCWDLQKRLEPGIQLYPSIHYQLPNVHILKYLEFIWIKWYGKEVLYKKLVYYNVHLNIVSILLKNGQFFITCFSRYLISTSFTDLYNFTLYLLVSVISGLNFIYFYLKLPLAFTNLNNYLKLSLIIPKLNSRWNNECIDFTTIISISTGICDSIILYSSIIYYKVPRWTTIENNFHHSALTYAMLKHNYKITINYGLGFAINLTFIRIELLK